MKVNCNLEQISNISFHMVHYVVIPKFMCHIKNHAFEFLYYSVYVRAVQSWSWRAAVLQILAPTPIKHSWTEVIKVSRITTIFQAGILEQAGAKSVEQALHVQDWTPLISVLYNYIY